MECITRGGVWGVSHIYFIFELIRFCSSLLNYHNDLAIKTAEWRKPGQNNISLAARPDEFSRDVVIIVWTPDSG